MKPPLLLACAVLLAAFAVYSHSGHRLEGPADKAVQFVTLVPAALLFASSLRRERRPLDLARRMLDRPGDAVFFAAVSLPVLAFTVWMAYGPLEGIPKGGDEAAYSIQSMIYARGEAAAPAPAVAVPRDLFPFRHFVFEGGRWFTMYTPMHALVMAPFTRAGVSPLLGPLEGVLALAGAFLLFRRMAGRTVARTALVLMAVSPFFLFMAPTHMAHNTELALVAWALYLVVESTGRSRPGWLQAAAGFLLGLSLCTKPYTVVPWAVTITVALLLVLRSRAFAALGRIAAGALPPVLLLLAANRFYTGDPFEFAYDLARGGSLIGFGPDRAWFPEYGDHAHTPLRGLMNLARQAGTGSTILLGWPFLSLLPPVFAFMDGPERRKWLLVAGSIAVFAPFMMLHYSASIDYGPRHYYTALPCFALLCAAGLSKAASRWGCRAVYAAGGLLVFSTLTVYIPDGIALRSGPWQSIDRVPADAARDFADPPAVIFMEASEHGYPNIVSGLEATDPFLDGDFVFCAHQEPEDDLEAMETIFSGRNAYLFWMEGSEARIEPWTASRAAELTAERDLRPEWAPSNTSGDGS